MARLAVPVSRSCCRGGRRALVQGVARAWQAAGGLFLVFLLLGRMLTAQETAVTFQVNDSMIKGKVLPGVLIEVSSAEGGTPLASGTTDAAGQLVLNLPPGRYQAAFAKAGYVYIPGTVIEVGAAPQTITTTMTMMMEAVGLTQNRRIQIVLNWGLGPDIPADLDSHVVCACASLAHVYYSAKKHEGEGHSAELDVDDIDGGGPETITLLDPPPGSYRYWVHNYSSWAPHLGKSQAVVRVVIGDAVAAEFRMPATITARVWSPFKAIEVDAALEPKIVRFTPEEEAANLPIQIPPEQTYGIEENTSDLTWGGIIASVLLAILVVAVMAVRRIIRQVA